MSMSVKNWISGDESAKEMLARVTRERPLLLLVPPLHRIPLRVGNVVEIFGPSPSAKSEILLQAAINCILPREWNGVHYGGLERLVVYFDLDCRFDVIRLSQLLRHHITMASGLNRKVNLRQQEAMPDFDAVITNANDFDEDLFEACMKRFFYIRCYESLEFLAALKTLRYRLRMESAAHGVAIHFLMIDSVGAYYWVDRAFKPLSQVGDKRKYLSFQNVVETVVQEIQKLLQGQPMLVLATKPAILGMGALTNEKRTSRKWRPHDLVDGSSKERGGNVYREYMPLVWQSFVTHRVLIHLSDRNFKEGKHEQFPIYMSQWVLPSLNVVDKFSVKDDGIFMVN